MSLFGDPQAETWDPTLSFKTLTSSLEKKINLQLTGQKQKHCAEIIRAFPYDHSRKPHSAQTCHIKAVTRHCNADSPQLTQSYVQPAVPTLFGFIYLFICQQHLLGTSYWLQNITMYSTCTTRIKPPQGQSGSSGLPRRCSNLDGQQPGRDWGVPFLFNAKYKWMS